MFYEEFDPAVDCLATLPPLTSGNSSSGVDESGPPSSSEAAYSGNEGEGKAKDSLLIRKEKFSIKQHIFGLFKVRGVRLCPRVRIRYRRN